MAERRAEKRGVGGSGTPKVELGRALPWPIYITATGLCLVALGPPLEYFSPWVYLLMQVSNSCSLHVTISNVPWWSLSWCIHLLEFNLNVGYNFSGVMCPIWKIHGSNWWILTTVYHYICATLMGCMLYWCSERVYKWSASLTVAITNCYWWFKVSWKRLMLLTHRPQIADMQYILHLLLCSQGYATDLYIGIFGAHMSLLPNQMVWYWGLSQNFFFLPVRGSYSWRASSLVEITRISIYLSVSKSQNTTFKKRQFSGFFWHRAFLILYSIF